MKTTKRAPRRGRPAARAYTPVPVPVPAPVAVRDTLAERGKTYGDYLDQSTTARALKDILHATPNWDRCHPAQQESLDMIATKLARLLHGDVNHTDSWHDVGGYAELVVDALVHGRIV